MAQVGRIASGYVYYVSLKGVTGAGHLDTDAVGQVMPRIRAHVKMPVGVGFGIRDAATRAGRGRGGRCGGDRHRDDPAAGSPAARQCALSRPRRRFIAEHPRRADA